MWESLPHIFGESVPMQRSLVERSCTLSPEKGCLMVFVSPFQVHLVHASPFHITWFGHQ